MHKVTSPASLEDKALPGSQGSWVPGWSCGLWENFIRLGKIYRCLLGFRKTQGAAFSVCRGSPLLAGVRAPEGRLMQILGWATLPGRWEQGSLPPQWQPSLL